MIPHKGASASITKKLSAKDVETFADLTGDQNPVHLDETYAQQTRFGKRIAHGMLGASLISTVLGMYLPGPGTIYLSQTLNFVAPVYLDDTLTAEVTVTNVREDKPIVTLETQCLNQDNRLVLKGEAVVLVEV